MEDEPRPGRSWLSRRDRRIFWALCTLLLLVTLLAASLFVRPWILMDPSGTAFGSSLRRTTDFGGSGNCEPFAGEKGIWSCAITGFSDYTSFVLWQSGREGCWKAQIVPGGRWTAATGYSGCAGIFDQMGIHSGDDPISPLPEKVRRRALSTDWFE